MPQSYRHAARSTLSAISSRSWMILTWWDELPLTLSDLWAMGLCLAMAIDASRRLADSANGTVNNCGGRSRIDGGRARHCGATRRKNRTDRGPRSPENRWSPHSRRGNRKPGDRLTKLLGATLLAAQRVELRWFEPMLEHAAAMRACTTGPHVQRRGVTDVTGFGLAGHLFEMPDASRAAIAGGASRCSWFC